VQINEHRFSATDAKYGHAVPELSILTSFVDPLCFGDRLALLVISQRALASRIGSGRILAVRSRLSPDLRTVARGCRVRIGRSRLPAIQPLWTKFSGSGSTLNPLRP